MDVVALTGGFETADLRIAVAVSDFNLAVTEGLLKGALQAFETAGVAEVTVAHVPGAFELPLAARQFAESGYDIVVALGAVVEGETDHYEHVAHRASEGLMRVSLDYGIPVSFGVLTTREGGHAMARSVPGPNNKGAETAIAALQTASVLHGIRAAARDLLARDRQESRRR
jgi:6,7-dimethyl-8-ribityllumazine synthase